MVMPSFQYSGNLGLPESFLHQMWPCTPGVQWGRSCPCAPTVSFRASQEKGIFLHQINPLKPGGTVKKLCREKRETQTGKKGLLPCSQNVACNLSTHTRNWSGQGENLSKFLERQHQNELRTQSQVPQHQIKRTQQALFSNNLCEV